MNRDAESFVTLSNGAAVYRAALDLYDNLIATHHAVRVDHEGALVVTNRHDLHLDVIAMIDGLHDDLVAVARSARPTVPPTVH